MEEMPDDVRLNDAILALEQAEGRIDEVENPEKYHEALDALNAVPVSVLEALVERLNTQAVDYMDDIDTTASHYTGCSGAMCMGVQYAADELEETIEEPVSE